MLGTLACTYMPSTRCILAVLSTLGFCLVLDCTEHLLGSFIVCDCRSPQLTVNLPGGVAYCAVDTTLPAGAPLRTVTVRDAITDLPVIENGHSE